ncbi:DUF1127 domain-containing protein [Sneathiella sp.]|uniref:DUF1127 domain-containing protein n=1 Tax=Sneathiella sp. TaxID=1964365 RepID=UPI003569CC8A
MMSYNKTDIEALALIEPVKSDNNNVVDTNAYIRRAHVMRSNYIKELLVSAYANTVGRYRKHRELKMARMSLYAMSDRELQDIGIARSEIDNAVEGYTSEIRTPLWKTLARKWEQARKFRAGFAELVAMDARQLADIGLTRGDVEAAIAGKRNRLANDNQTAANNNSNNDRRHAV